MRRYILFQAKFHMLEHGNAILLKRTYKYMMGT